MVFATTSVITFDQNMVQDQFSGQSKEEGSLCYHISDNIQPEHGTGPILRAEHRGRTVFATTLVITFNQNMVHNQLSGQSIEDRRSLLSHQ